MRNYNKDNKFFVPEQEGFPVHLHVGDKPIPFHCHHEIELISVRRGSAAVRFSSHVTVLEKGQLMFVNKGVMHAIECSDGALYSYISMSDEFISPAGSSVSVKYIKPFAENTDMPFVLIDGSSLWHGEAYSISERMAALLLKYGKGGYSAAELDMAEQTSHCYELEVLCCAVELWRVLFSSLGAGASRPATGNEYVVRRRTQLMTDFIRQNYRNEISLEDIAASANISKSEASRCFQSCLRVSPVSYLLRYRTEMAAQLLQNSSLTIEEISFECGFGSASYFCKMFRQYAGVTPGQYRKGAKTEKA